MEMKNDSVRYKSLDQTPEYFMGFFFEQHEPPTKDKVTQINLGDEANPKLIFISKSS